MIGVYECYTINTGYSLFVVPPAAFWSTLIFPSLHILLVLLDSSSHPVQRHLLQMFPVVEQAQDIADCRSEVRIRSQHVPNQIAHLLRMHSLLVLYTSVDYTKLALVLEWVVLVVHYVKDAAQHPDIHSVVNRVLQVKVNHLGRTVHQRSVFLETLFVLVEFGLRHRLQVYLLTRTASQVAQFGHSFFRQQNVFDLHVLVEHV